MILPTATVILEGVSYHPTTPQLATDVCLRLRCRSLYAGYPNGSSTVLM
jgi:hypothetical protein